MVFVIDKTRRTSNQITVLSLLARSKHQRRDENTDGCCGTFLSEMFTADGEKIEDGESLK